MACTAADRSYRELDTDWLGEASATSAGILVAGVARRRRAMKSRRPQFTWRSSNADSPTIHVMSVQCPKCSALPASVCASELTEKPCRYMLEIVMPNLPSLLERRANAADYAAAPLDVFYVVETTDRVVGERKHRVCPPLFETRPQACRALAGLRGTKAPGTLSIWKGTTHIEPARWSYDVVMADGTTIAAGG